MNFIEGPTIEFKQIDSITNKIPNSLKDACAFLNTEGGTIYLGIDDNGNVVGIDQVDDTMTRLSNTLKDTILPDITPFINIEPIQINQHYIIKCEIETDTKRPYYLSKMGLRPGGVYRRVGSLCQMISEHGIREMIIEISGKSYEESRSFNQELTFKVSEEEFQKRNIDFDKQKMKSMKMIGNDDLYTNLALLLSDQCPFTTKVAIFQEHDPSIIKDRYEFTGSLLQQLNEAYHIINLSNPTIATFNDLIRKDVRGYPPTALRESLLNAIVHRTYTIQGSNIINIYNNHIELISQGSLVSGLSLEAIQLGISLPNNPNLAAIFYRMELIESYGTGIRKTIDSYYNMPCLPEIKTAPGVFYINLPRLHQPVQPSTSYVKEKQANYQTNSTTLLLQLLSQKEIITRKDVEIALGISQTPALNLLKKLCNQWILIQQKQGKLTIYKKSS